MSKINELIGFRPKEYVDTEPHKWNDFFGIELELENVNPIGDDGYYVDGWSTHEDASLRNGIEFVTNCPMGGLVLQNTIDKFYDKGFTWSAGARTSTHIHVNILDCEDVTLQSVVMLMYMIEDGVYSIVEEDRKWGGYSVALTEMPVARLRGILNPSSPTAFINGICPSRNAERYYGLNTNVRRHGTLEFRYFPGGPTKEELHDWIDLVMMVKSIAKRFTPSDLIDVLTSPDRVRYFLVDNFGSWGQRLLEAYPAHKYFSAFSEVAAMAADEDTREIMNRVVCIHPPYLEFLAATVFKKKPEGLKYLRAMVQLGNVYSDPDWSNILAEAKRRDVGSDMKDLSYEQVLDAGDNPYEAIRFGESTTSPLGTREERMAYLSRVASQRWETPTPTTESTEDVWAPSDLMDWLATETPSSEENT